MGLGALILRCSDLWDRRFRDRAREWLRVSLVL